MKNKYQVVPQATATKKAAKAEISDAEFPPAAKEYL